MDPAVAQESRTADLDPVVAEILAMLDAGVDEGVILQWLESTDRRPADVGSQGLIALAEAEASEEFVKTLLTRVENQGADPPDLAAPPPPATPRSCRTDLSLADHWSPGSADASSDCEPSGSGSTRTNRIGLEIRLGACFYIWMATSSRGRGLP